MYVVYDLYMETEELLYPCFADFWKWIADRPAVHFLYSDLVAFVWWTVVNSETGG